MKRLHINGSQDILWAWQTGLPLAALCGYTRRLSEKEHDANLHRRACRKCMRIAAAYEATGQGTKPEKYTAKQLRKRGMVSRNISWTVTSNPAVWQYFSTSGETSN